MDPTHDTSVPSFPDLFIQRFARVHLLLVSYRFSRKGQSGEHRCSAIFGLPAKCVLRLAPELQKIVRTTNAVVVDIDKARSHEIGVDHLGRQRWLLLLHHLNKPSQFVDKDVAGFEDLPITSHYSISANRVSLSHFQN